MKTITYTEIKEMLAKKHLGHVSLDDMSRELVVYKATGRCKMMMLSGSPPKGYCIYIENHRTVNLYDVTGKRFKRFAETEAIPDDEGIE